MKILSTAIIALAMISTSGTAHADTFTSESFEAWDGNDTQWLPNGWSVVSHGSDKLDPVAHWLVTIPQAEDYAMPPATDGKYFMCCGYSDDFDQDEWLMMPPFTPGANDLLTFDLYASPLFYFFTDAEHFNDNNLTFIKKEQCSNFEVMVRKTGEEEWRAIYDGASHWQTQSALELMSNEPDGLEPYEFDLSTFGNTPIEIAFRYSGRGGNSVYLDNVRLKSATSIKNATIATPHPAATYTLQGQKLKTSNLQPGIYIERRSDGSTVKKMVK